MAVREAMDSAEIADAVNQAWPHIKAAIAAYGNGLLTRAQQGAVNATAQAGHRLLQAVYGRLSGDRKKALEQKVENVAAAGAPGSGVAEGAVAELQEELRQLLLSDAGLATEFRAILVTAPGSREASGDGAVSVNAPTGTVHTGHGAVSLSKASGNHIVINNNTYSTPRGGGRGNHRRDRESGPGRGLWITGVTLVAVIAITALTAFAYPGWYRASRVSAQAPRPGTRTTSPSSTRPRASVSPSTSAGATPATSAVAAPSHPAAASAPPGIAASPGHTTIAAALDSNGIGDVFALDSEGHLFDARQESSDGSWGPWESFGPDGGVNAVTAAADQAGLLNVMAVMPDDSVQERSETAPGRWGSWTSFAAGGTAKALALGQDPDGDLEAFAATPSGQLEARKELAPGSGTWGSWTSLNVPGDVQSVTAMREISGTTLDVIAVTTDGALERATDSHSGWSAWTSFAPATTKAVGAAIAQKANGLESVFALTSRGTLTEKYQEQSGSWHGWATPNLPSCSVSSFYVAAQSKQILTMLAACDNGQLQSLGETEPDGDWIGRWSPFPGGSLP
jgi:hypothetical protein